MKAGGDGEPDILEQMLFFPFFRNNRLDLINLNE